MKDIEVIEDVNVFCENCNPAGQENATACGKTAILDITSDHVFRQPDGSYSLTARCARQSGHAGQHTACCKRGSITKGLWTRFHVTWED